VRLHLRRVLVAVAATAVTGTLILPTPAVRAAPATPDPTGAKGAPGVGDPYFPLDGNGGYDARHYLLDLGYEPTTGRLSGVATMTARATEDLSGFNLDLAGLTVRSVTVNGMPATFDRGVDELVITPAIGLPKGREFTVVTRYDGTPQPVGDGGGEGFLRTGDGVTVAGEPHVADTWFPVNDHPTDKASYTFDITVPAGLSVVANGRLAKKSGHSDGTATWVWDAPDPMASYLATISIGHFAMTTYDKDGIRFTDAVASPVAGPAVTAARTGRRVAYSGAELPAYKRLARTVDVPAGGATLAFGSHFETADTGYFIVEVHPVGTDDWTTLPDRDKAPGSDADGLCDELGTHPFLAHYLSKGADGTCRTTGSTGSWNAYGSASDEGWQDWTVDLGAYAGRRIEVALSYLTTEAHSWGSTAARTGVYLDDVVLSTGSGSTSFEADSDILDGWTTPPAPAGSPAAPTGWRSLTVSQLPMSAAGQVAYAALARQPEILRLQSQQFGPYPFDTSGAIITTAETNLSLEHQTRPTYNTGILTSEYAATTTIVHELAHQWFGDHVSVDRWKDIWLNEGFATYAEWLWAEKEGLGTAQAQFDSLFDGDTLPDSAWNTPLADPGAAKLFGGRVYLGGAMTLHALRMTVGDATFFAIVKAWVRDRAGRNGGSQDFATLAGKVAHRDLSGFFNTWVFGSGKPPRPAGRGVSGQVTRRSLAR
jgi:hypothetical protein